MALNPDLQMVDGQFWAANGCSSSTTISTRHARGILIVIVIKECALSAELVLIV